MNTIEPPEHTGTDAAASPATATPHEPSLTERVRSAYPQPGAQARPDRLEQIQKDAAPPDSSVLYDILTLALGVGSSVSFVALGPHIKNVHEILWIGALLALIAVALGVRNFLHNGVLSPWGVVGLCASTITLVTVANLLIAQSNFHSVVPSLPY
ncbi:MAG TPA: hypothetical protein VLF71_00775 [Candidatus Saccharimonadales bacterium]|nr:hypothetical protein [Candidatus Saccharimonadales bacterium]